MMLETYETWIIANSYNVGKETIHTYWLGTIFVLTQGPDQ